jgi:hypothetical protein
MYIYKYVQLHIILLQEYLSVTPVTIIKVSYEKNTIKIQIIVQTFMIKPLTITLHFQVNLSVLKIICLRSC